MKKVLSTVAALGLVVGFAATASALDVPQKVEKTTALPMAISGEHFGITGDWSLLGVTINNALTSAAGAAADLNNDSASDSVYIHSFRINPTLRINDKIQVKGHLRFMDREVFGAAAPLTPSSRMLDVRQIYMDYMSPVGRIQAGRMAAGAWGSDFLSSSAQAARIRWYPSFVSSPWSMLLFVQQGEMDAANGLVSDGDKNSYYAGVGHSGDMGKTDVALLVTRNGSGTPGDGLDAAYTNQLWFNGNYNIEGFSVETELAYVFGDDGGSVDNSALGFMIDVGMKVGEADLGLMYAYASGDDTVGGDTENMMAFTSGFGMGADFNPFLILTGDYTGILNGDKNGIASGVSMAGASMVAVHGAMKVNDKLTVNGTIGTAWANEVASGIDEQYGWEVDLGASYALYDNLSYGVHFGYLATGDYFETTPAGVAAGGATEDVVMLAHQLTMKF